MVSLRSNKSLTKTACSPGLWTQLESKTKMQSLTFLSPQQKDQAPERTMASYSQQVQSQRNWWNEISKEFKAKGLVDATLVLNYEINQSSQKIAILDLGLEGIYILWSDPCQGADARLMPTKHNIVKNSSAHSSTWQFPFNDRRITRAHAHTHERAHAHTHNPPTHPMGKQEGELKLFSRFGTPWQICHSEERRLLSGDAKGWGGGNGGVPVCLREVWVALQAEKETLSNSWGALTLDSLAN